MPTSEERREIAARLRITKAECDERDYPWMVEDLLQAIGFERYEDGEDGIFDRLADLIDLSTCNNVSEFGHNTASSFDFVCSHCGSRLIGDGMYCSPLVDNKFSHYGIKFCPNCGAEVVE